MAVVFAAQREVAYSHWRVLGLLEGLQDGQVHRVALGPALDGRQQVLETLAGMRRVRGERAREVLTRVAATDADRLVRRQAVGYLAKLGFLEAMGVLRWVEGTDRCLTVRRWASWVLAGGVEPGPLGGGFDAEYPPIWAVCRPDD